MIISAYSSFYIPSNKAEQGGCTLKALPPSPKIQEKDALKVVLSYCKLLKDKKLTQNILKGGVEGSGVKTRLSYLQLESGSLELVWNINLKVTSSSLIYCDAMVSASSGELLAFYDMINH
jgi:hypothetical protein